VSDLICASAPRPRARPTDIPRGAEAIHRAVHLLTVLRRRPSRRVPVTSQQIGFDDYCAGDIPVSRILSMLAGEALRLKAYAVSGFIDLRQQGITSLDGAPRPRP
jgi:hypothetical protein